jgi:hypothetical protein
MTDEPRTDARSDAETGRTPVDASPEEESYLYRNSGIQERRGAVPLWLQAVCYGLLVWAIYYTVTYWNTG